jgi:hypothetical protein
VNRAAFMGFRHHDTTDPKFNIIRVRPENQQGR